jgi:carbamoyltransferase
VFTQYLGFEVNEGEYKVMGLAPYGTPRFVKKILDKMIFLNDDGSFHLDQSFFDFISREKHYSSNFIKSLGILPRKAGGLISQEHKDLAASIQKVLEIAILHMLKKLLAIYNYDSVCMAGGVALNCTANAEILRELGVKLYIQPAAGDAGGALGAAMDIAMEKISKSQYRFPFTPYLGTEYSDAAIKTILEINNITAHRLPNIAFIIAKHLSEGNVVGVVHGRDEWGPRALGNRSILADPRQANMKDHLNAKIKFREEFRPFAPVIMEEFASQYFEMLDMNNSPYMLFTHKTLKPNDIPAVVHEDNTSRIQTLSASQNPYLYAVLSEFYKITGIPVLINTSFNLKGEPIVSSPSDALKTFFASGIDFLAIENFLIEKTYDKRLSI